jgi:hypothetical protein
MRLVGRFALKKTVQNSGRWTLARDASSSPFRIEVLYW